MIILDATTKSVEIILAGAVTTTQLPFVASYVDVTTTTYVPGENDGTSNSTAAVTVVAAPGASTQRHIKLIDVQNADTVAATVTLRYNNNATTRTLVKVALGIGAHLIYTDGEGWRVLDASGSVMTTLGATALGSQVTGILPPANGGTGVANAANNAITFTGNYTLGFTVTGNTALTLPTSGTLFPTTGGTLVGNLLFTDATYDIGASGATRPRDLFLSRNAVIGGTLNVTGVATLAASTISLRGVTYTLPVNDGDANQFLQSDGAGVLAWAAGGLSAGSNYINDTFNAFMTTGLTINQGAADDEILALKSSDVAHGMTSLAETDTYGQILKGSANNGVLRLVGYSDTNAFGLELVSRLVGSGDVTKSAAAVGFVRVLAQEKSGTSATTPTANSNLFVVEGNGVQFILDADGDSHQNVGTAWTNFDDADDIARLDAVAVALARENDPLREQFLTHFEEHRSLIEAMPGKKLIQFNDDGQHFVNMSRLAMLHNGAIRQIAREMGQLRQSMRQLTGADGDA